jgi:hypothetical protein
MEDQKPIQIVSILGPPFTGKYNLYKRTFEKDGYLFMDNSSDFDEVKKKSKKICFMCNDLDEQVQFVNEKLKLKSDEYDLKQVFVKPRHRLIQPLWASEFAFAENMDDVECCKILSAKLEKLYDYIRSAAIN